jgi:hypothetical protein
VARVSEGGGGYFTEKKRKEVNSVSYRWQLQKYEYIIDLCLLFFIDFLQ